MRRSTSRFARAELVEVRIRRHREIATKRVEHEARQPWREDGVTRVVGLSLVALGIAGFAGAVDLAGIERSALVPIALLAIAAAIAATVRRSTLRSPTQDELDRAEQAGM